MRKTSPGLLRVQSSPRILLFFHSWPLIHQVIPLYHFQHLLILEALQSYALCWPREINLGQLEMQQRKGRIVLFLHTRYRFLSLLPSFACSVFTHSPFSGHPGSVKGEGGQQEHPQSTFQAGGQEGGAVVPNTLWDSEIVPFHCWLCTKQEHLRYQLHFLLKIIITWVFFFFKIRAKKNLQRPVWMTFCRTFRSPFSLKSGGFARVHTERGGLTSQRINTRKQIVLYKSADKWCNYNQEWARFLFLVCGLQLLCVAPILPMLQQAHPSEWRNGNTCTAQESSCRESATPGCNIPCAWGSHTPKQAHLQPHKPLKTKQTRGTAHPSAESTNIWRLFLQLD